MAESRALLFITFGLPPLLLIQALGWVNRWDPAAVTLVAMIWISSLYEHRMLSRQRRRTSAGLLVTACGFIAIMIGIWRTDPLIVFWWPLALFFAFLHLPPRHASAVGAATLVLTLAVMSAADSVTSSLLVRTASLGTSLLWIFWLFFSSARRSLAELSQARALLEATKEHMKQGLIVVGADRRIKVFNHRAAELIDLPLELLRNEPQEEDVIAYQEARGDFSLHGQNIDPRIGPHLTREVPDGRRPDRAGPETYTRRTASGRFVLVETTALPAGGAVRTYTDITDFELVNQQLRMVLQEYDALRAREREDANESLVQALSKLSMYRDDETGQHIVRTQMYIRTLALALRARGHYAEHLGDQQIDQIVKAAPMHDLGKIGIPDHILKKPGRHTPEETAVMRTHAMIGETTLMAAASGSVGQNALLLAAARIAGGHHEHWDGSGYPRGLAGQAIPLEARLMSLADVYDALTTARVYKLAWSHEDALAEIRRLRGIRFDPVLVDTLVSVEREFRSIARRLSDVAEEVTE